MPRPARPRRLLTAALTAGLVAVSALTLGPAAHAGTTDPAPQPSPSSAELTTTVNVSSECIEGYTVVIAKIHVDLDGGPNAAIVTNIDGDVGSGVTTDKGDYETGSRVKPGTSTVSVTVNGGTPIVKTIDTTKTCSPEPTPTPTETSTPTPTPTPTSTTEPTQTPVPTATPAASLSRSTVAPGTQLTVTGSGFTSGESIELWFHSTPVKLATLTAAADGTFSQAVTIPAGMETGAHTIEVRGGISGSVSLALSVVPGLAVTGADDAVLLPIGGVAALFMTAGAVLFAIARTRSRHQGSGAV